MFSLLAAVALASGTHCGYEGEIQASGLARDPENGNLVYCEFFLPTRNDRTRVLYYSPEGYRIAEKTLITAGAEIPRNTARPEVMQQDYRHGEERQVVRINGQWELRYRESGEAGWEEHQADDAAVDVIDAGFDAFVRESWDQLSSGQPVEFDFASALHGRAITLRARRARCEGGERNRLCLKVVLAQPLLRLFAGELFLVYGTEQRRLESFEGIVNLLDSSGDSQRLRIDYRYY